MEVLLVRPNHAPLYATTPSTAPFRWRRLASCNEAGVKRDESTVRTVRPVLGVQTVRNCFGFEWRRLLLVLFVQER